MDEQTLTSYEKNTINGKIKEGYHDGKSLKGRPTFIHLPGNVSFSHELKEALTVF